MPATDLRQVLDEGSFRPSWIATLRSRGTRKPGLMDPSSGPPPLTGAVRQAAKNE